MLKKIMFALIAISSTPLFAGDMSVIAWDFPQGRQAAIQSAEAMGFRKSVCVDGAKTCSLMRSGDLHGDPDDLVLYFGDADDKGMHNVGGLHHDELKVKSVFVSTLSAMKASQCQVIKNEYLDLQNNSEANGGRVACMNDHIMFSGSPEPKLKSLL